MLFVPLLETSHTSSFTKAYIKQYGNYYAEPI